MRVFWLKKEGSFGSRGAIVWPSPARLVVGAGGIFIFKKFLGHAVRWDAFGWGSGCGMGWISLCCASLPLPRVRAGWAWPARWVRVSGFPPRAPGPDAGVRPGSGLRRRSPRARLGRMEFKRVIVGPGSIATPLALPGFRVPSGRRGVGWGWAGFAPVRISGWLFLRRSRRP